MQAVTIVPYDPAWCDDFHLLRAHLREALGNLAQSIDHIGSTAVPGLDAKDIIDVQIGVTSLAVIGPRVTALDAAGFEPLSDIVRDHVPPLDSRADEQWSKMFFRSRAPLRAANVHVRIAGHANHRYALLFRDYLRCHPQAAAAYGTLKRTLALHCVQNRDAYVLVKDPVCDIIMAAALDWAQRTGWNASESVTEG